MTLYVKPGGPAPAGVKDPATGWKVMPGAQKIDLTYEPGKPAAGQLRLAVADKAEVGVQLSCTAADGTVAVSAPVIYPLDPWSIVARPFLWPGEDARFPLGSDSLGRGQPFKFLGIAVRGPLHVDVHEEFHRCGPPSPRSAAGSILEPIRYRRSPNTRDARA